MPLYEYMCEACGEFEAMKPMDERHTAECPNCGQVGDQMISTPRISLDSASGDFPGATMKWERQRKQKYQQEKKSAE